jgi:hypothetical protein
MRMIYGMYLRNEDPEKVGVVRSRDVAQTNVRNPNTARTILQTPFTIVLLHQFIRWTHV